MAYGAACCVLLSACVVLQLEQKCFSQQERLEAVQERLDSERHAWQELEKDLTLKTDQVPVRT